MNNLRSQALFMNEVFGHNLPVPIDERWDGYASRDAQCLDEFPRTRWVEIADIKQVREQDVYDIGVEPDSGPLADSHCFAANGFVAHNSMGCLAGYVECSICEHKSDGRTQNMCKHVHPQRGGKGLIVNGRLTYELCCAFNYIETSSVDDPADWTATSKDVM